MELIELMLISVSERVTKVVHHDGAMLGLVKPVGQAGGSGFVDDSQHLQPGNAPGILRSLGTSGAPISF
eukprot:971488-Prorocentrum_minimum.AAC.1